MEVTTKEYAARHNIEVNTARKRLNDMVRAGKAKVTKRREEYQHGPDRQYLSRPTVNYYTLLETSDD